MKKENKEFFLQYKDELVRSFVDYESKFSDDVTRQMTEVYQNETGEEIDIEQIFRCSCCKNTFAVNCAKLYFSEYPNEVPEDLSEDKKTNIIQRPIVYNLL